MSAKDEIQTAIAIHREAQALCAAGPWRTDYENITEDGIYILTYPTGWQVGNPAHDSGPYRWPFATINPPEVQDV